MYSLKEISKLRFDPAIKLPTLSICVTLSEPTLGNNAELELASNAQMAETRLPANVFDSSCL